jgi:hypothetical protein
VIGAAQGPLAARPGLSYLRVMLKPAHQGSLPQTGMMAGRPPRGATFAIVVGGAAIAVVMVLAAAVLWMRYGTAVFFEMIAAGLAACF